MMTLPNQPSIELPLLLELERAGASVRPGPEFYAKVAAHFPDIQPGDRLLLRNNGRTKVWENTVDWARNTLRLQDQLSGGKGDGWQIREAGRSQLRSGLRGHGLTEAELETFIRSRQTLPQKLGAAWRPSPLRLRGDRRRREGQGTPSSKRDSHDPPASADVLGGPRVAPGVGDVVVAPQSRPNDISAQLIERIRALTDDKFESFCGRLLEAMGFEDVRITGRSHDRGIDGHATLKHLGLRIAFQAKNWRNNQVGGPRVREFRGSIVNRFPMGVCVTTSSFTTGAVEEANEPGPPQIELIDGAKLVEIMLEKGLGVHTVPVTRQEVSEGFFASI